MPRQAHKGADPPPATTTAARATRRTRFKGSYKLPDADYKDDMETSSDDDVEMADAEVPSTTRKRNVAVIEVSSDDDSIEMTPAAMRPKSIPKKKLNGTLSPPSAPTKMRLAKDQKANPTARAAETPTKPQSSTISKPSGPLRGTSAYEVCITIPEICTQDCQSVKSSLIKLMDHYAFAILHQHDAMAKSVIDTISQCKHIDLNVFFVMAESFYDHAARNAALIVSDMCSLIEKAFGGFLFSIVAADLVNEIVKERGPMKDLLYQQISAYYRCNLTDTSGDRDDDFFRPFIRSLEEEVHTWLDEAKQSGQR